MSTEELRQRCEAHGQGHLFRFWGDLDQDARARLSAQVQELDLDLVARLGALLDAGPPPPAAKFEPPDVFPLERGPELRQRAREARDRGAAELAAGRVGFVLVAGGQGSRLGFEGPKGSFPIGPVSGRTLFGWHAARLLAARERHAALAPWYVMTSSANDEDTRAFFARHDYFGLGPENVRFFQQAMLPALDSEGRVVMSAPDTLFLAPNGHGGTLEALARSGCLAHAAERGVEQLSYFQVDSPLARPADALFLGLHVMAASEMSSKVVTKRDAHEKVGVLGLADGKLGCIEYYNLPGELRDRADGNGNLLFRAGNIANHLLRRDFVERLTSGGLVLPWHLARKRMPMLDERGLVVEREGIKFETFVFDALGFSQNSVTLEVDRRLEFSPVKNAAGENSPASCRAELCALFGGWVERAGGELPAPGSGPNGLSAVEVDPRFAEDEEAFRGRWPAVPEEVDGGHLYA